MELNLPGNGTESVVAWSALAVDGAWHGSALIPLVVNTAGRFSSGSLCVDIRKKHVRRIVSLFAALGVPMRKETPECAKKHQEATGGPGQPREGGRRMPRETPRSPGRPPTGPKMAQDNPKMAQDAPKRPPAGPKTGPRWPQDAPGGPQLALRWPKIAPRWHKMPPRGPQLAPRWAQVGPR